MSQNLTLYCTSAVLLLDNEGQRIIAKYYFPPAADIFPVPKGGLDFHNVKDQRTFETSIYEKTRKVPNGEILLHAGHIVLYRTSVDVTLYVVGPESENELMLATLSNSLYDSISQVLRHTFEKRAILENLDLVVLALDETIDDGVILETDTQAVLSRVSRPRNDSGVQLADITINEDAIRQAFGTLRDRVRRFADGP